MGWGYCGKMLHRNDGGPGDIGYMVEATCDERGCEAVIDRGLSCICGRMHHDRFSDEPGCGGYFCEDHRGYRGPRGGCRHRRWRRFYGRQLTVVTYE